MIAFTPVNPADRAHLNVLFFLLSERTEDQSISHKKMPSWDEHVSFVSSRPYLEWYIISLSNNGSEKRPIGCIYLTHNREIGITISEVHSGKGFGRKALELFIAANQNLEKPFFANINPKNTASIKLFESLGFKHIQNQNTYRLESHD